MSGPLRPAEGLPGATKATEPLEVSLNGAPRRLGAGTTIAALLASLGATTGVAVALNEEVVPRSRWAATYLDDHDRIEVLVPTQGG